MLLGCNYSIELVQLIDSGQCRVDYLKYAIDNGFWEHEMIARAHGPVLLHSVGYGEHAGMKELAHIDWDQINTNIERFKSPHLAYHLHTTLADWDGKPNDDQIISRLIEITRVWAHKIHVPLLIENSTYHSGSSSCLKIATDPSVISTVCKEADVGLLLDLAHVRVAAYHRREEPHDYISQLPLERVQELHVVGAMMTEDGLRDRHQEMEDQDYTLLEWVLARCKPQIVTLEYGGLGTHYAGRSDLLSLKRQLHRLSQIIM